MRIEMEPDIARAAAYGSTGVPFFVIDQKYGVSGAQPTELFSQLLELAWTERAGAALARGATPARSLA